VLRLFLGQLLARDSFSRETCELDISLVTILFNETAVRFFNIEKCLIFNLVVMRRGSGRDLSIN
jgi:hypothetical protein